MDKTQPLEVRDECLTPSEFWNSVYAREMKRRFEYYQGLQFVHTPADSETLPTPKAWAASWSGSGWSDVKVMLPDIYDQQYIAPVGMRFVSIVIDNRQVVYTVPPEKRTLVKATAPQTDETALLKRIYDAAQHDLMADQLCKWSGLFHTAFQYTGWDPAHKRVVKRNLKPYEVYVIPSPEAPTDLQHPDCFVAIAQPPAAITRTDAHVYDIVWQCWYRGEYWYEKTSETQYKDLALTIEGRNKNPYTYEGAPVKPILVVHDQASTEMYYQGPDNLVLQNQRLDRGLTSLAHTMEYQGFAIAVARGLSPEEAQGQGWSPGSLFCLPDKDSDLSFEHPAAPVGEHFSAILKQARMFARLEGVDPEVVDPEVRIASGVSKAQSRRVLSEKREEQFPKWAPYERESYWLTAIVWNTFARVKKLPVMTRFEDIEDPAAGYSMIIEFGELNPVVDPLADMLEKGHRLNMGFNTLAELIAAERRIPISRAEEVAKANRAQNTKDGFVGSALTGTERIGQSGNRPRDPARPAGKSGQNTTSDSGNSPMAQGAVGAVKGGRP